MSKPPVAEPRDHLRDIHGHRFNDPYFYMRHREDDPSIDLYLKAENAYADTFFAPLAELKQKLFEEFKGRLKLADESVPAKDGVYEYWSRFSEGKEYRTHLRRRLDGGTPEVILDGNLLAEHRAYFKLGTLNWSHDHEILAFSEDHDGSEVFCLRFKSLTTGMLYPEVIAGTSYGGAWAADGQRFFYVKQNDKLRPYQIWCHTIGNEQEQDELIFEEEDERFFLSCSESMSRQYVFIESHGVNTSEVYFFDASAKKPDPKSFRPRQAGVEYSCYHQDERFLMLTNEDAVDFKVTWTPVSQVDGSWRELVPHEAGCLLEALEVTKGFVAVFFKRQGSEGVLIITKDGQSHVVTLPEDYGSVSAGDMYEYDCQTLRLVYSSMVTPQTVYDYDIGSRQLVTRKVQEIPSGYDHALYGTERVFAKAEDGASIPITIVHRRDVPRDGSAKAYVYAYGAYGIGITPSFSTNWLSLLDRGMVCAIAHVRGGDDLGRSWYENGKLDKKMNSFRDLIACCEALIESNWTSKGQIAIVGGSAGGMLVGAVANMAPDLLGAVVADVPFVDCINTMLDPDLPLTQTEYNEWGNPEEKHVYDRMLAYSPYENVKAQNYPAMLITAGLNDPRVTYWEPAKWCARLRSLKTNDKPLLFKIHMEAGHGGKSGRFAALEDLSEQYAFVLKVLDVAS